MPDTEIIIVECPHCRAPIVIAKNELNCRIFRHGVYKTTLQQIDPHLCKSVCDELARTEQIYGCGKPFYMDESNNAVVCDYI